MDNQTNKILPDLRFPEFEKDGEWKEKKLGGIVTKVGSGVTPLGGESNYKKVGRPFVRSQNVSWGVFLLDNIAFIDEATHQNSVSTEIELEDVLLNITGASIGRSAVANELVSGGNVNQHVCIIRTQKDILNPFFVNQFLISELGQKQIDSFQAGGNRQGLNFEQIRSFIIPTPPTSLEQQKIAFCLSSLDEVIAAHSQKLDALKEHKKGLMQNLFPQEGETVPKWRFPEFVNDGEWVEKKLGEVATILKGKGISKSDIVENGNLPCIRYGELYTHYHETIVEIKSYTNLMADDLVLSQANDVIIPASGETQIDIATASCVLKNGIALGGDLNIIRTKVNGVFLSYYLNNVKKKDIAQLAQGISVVHLYPNQLKTLVLNMPNSKEQQKIAECLSSLDDLITTQSKKIEQLKLHKKGLMQGLFPKTND